MVNIFLKKGLIYKCIFEVLVNENAPPSEKLIENDNNEWGNDRFHFLSVKKNSAVKGFFYIFYNFLILIFNFNLYIKFFTIYNLKYIILYYLIFSYNFNFKFKFKFN